MFESASSSDSPDTTSNAATAASSLSSTAVTTATPLSSTAVTAATSFSSRPDVHDLPATDTPSNGSSPPLRFTTEQQYSDPVFPTLSVSDSRGDRSTSSAGTSKEKHGARHKRKSNLRLSAGEDVDTDVAGEIMEENAAEHRKRKKEKKKKKKDEDENSAVVGDAKSKEEKSLQKRHGHEKKEKKTEKKKEEKHTKRSADRKRDSQLMVKEREFAEQLGEQRKEGELESVEHYVKEEAGAQVHIGNRKNSTQGDEGEGLRVRRISSRIDGRPRTKEEEMQVCIL